MARYLLFALHGPTSPEEEEEFNRWYDEVHLPDVKSVPGVKSGRRYKIVRGEVRGVAPWPYAVAYEIETDDFDGLVAELGETLSRFSPTFDRSTSASFFGVQISGDE